MLKRRRKNKSKKDGKSREYDQSQLKLSRYKYQPHKDFLGHIFRWGFASRYVNPKCKVLDVGCGQEMPFARSLGGSNPGSAPKIYVGCDLSKIKSPITKINYHTRDEFNFVENYRKIQKEFGKFDVIVNFEVFEHMIMEHGRKMLKGFKRCLDEGGKLIISTPVFCSTYGQAPNHINEVTKAVMEEELHKAGFKIISQHGTFNNWNDIKKAATEDEINLYNVLSQFYGHDVLGCFLSPKYPEAARNITHICVHKDNPDYDECELKKSIVKS